MMRSVRRSDAMFAAKFGVIMATRLVFPISASFLPIGLCSGLPKVTAMCGKAR